MSLKADCLRLRPGLICRRVDGRYQVEDEKLDRIVSPRCPNADLAWWHAYIWAQKIRQEEGAR